MFLKNYTSGAPVSHTIARIEEVLIRCKVTGITKEYAPSPSGEVSALLFHLKLTEGLPVTIRLAPKVNEAQTALWINYVNGEEVSADGKSLRYGRKNSKRKSDFRDQAMRTAWKLLQDRVEVEMSLIELQQRELVEAFMADVWDGKQTYFEAVRGNQYRAMIPESVG